METPLTSPLIRRPYHPTLNKNNRRNNLSSHVTPLNCCTPAVPTAGIDPYVGLLGPPCFYSPSSPAARYSFTSCTAFKGERNSVFIIWWIILGLIAGFITGKLMKGSGFGALGDIVVGILGAIIGGYIMRFAGFSGQGGLLYTILVAVVGAVILTLLLRLVTGNRSRNL